MPVQNGSMAVQRDGLSHHWSTDQRGLPLPCLWQLEYCTACSVSSSIHAFPQRASSLHAIAPIAAESLLNSNMAMHVHITCIRTLHTLRYPPSSSLQASCVLQSTYSEACTFRNDGKAHSIVDPCLSVRLELNCKLRAVYVPLHCEPA